MAGQFDGLGLEVFLRGFFFHDSLGNLDDFVDKLYVILDVVLFDIKGVDDISESVTEVVEGLIVEFTVDRVHFCDFEVDYFDKVEHVRHAAQYFLLARL